MINGPLEVDDVVVVETLQTGVIVSLDRDADTVEFKHDEDGKVYRVQQECVRHLLPGEERLR